MNPAAQKVRWWRAVALAAGLTSAMVGSGCGRPTETLRAAPPRAGRFGSLRDLFLYERPNLGPSGALFVDRFEVTIGDWRAFTAAAEGRAVDAADVPTTAAIELPVGFVDLRQARAFAKWRFMRLPRVDEWAFAIAGGGRSKFPWGDRDEWTRANTSELGLAQPTPVGTFESGRRVGGDFPYDLVGNVSEWTESVAPEWWTDDQDPTLPSLESGAAIATVRASPALMTWQLPGGITPALWVAAAGGSSTPRIVVGADFQTPMRLSVDQRKHYPAIIEDLQESVPAGDRRLHTGLRLVATATELLANLVVDRQVPTEADREQLRRFVARSGHREVLAKAWLELWPAGPTLQPEQLVARVLQLELAPSQAGDGR